MEHETNRNQQYHKELKKKMDEFAHLVYKITKKFPPEERFGLTSQLRRAAISVILNYIEGYARQGEKVKQNFYRISYGSLKESKYLVHFSLTEEFMNKQDYTKAISIADEIGAMLWSTFAAKD